MKMHSPSLLGTIESEAVSRGQALARFHLESGRPNQRQLDWLRAQGISVETLIRPWPINASRVRFDGRYFDFDQDGAHAITIAVIDAGELIDIAAWQPCTGELASWLGTAFAIGQDAVFNAATYAFHSALHVHASPLQWLQANRRGIVILRPKLCNAYLAQRERLAFDDVNLKRRVQQWMEPPRPRARLLVAKPPALATITAKLPACVDCAEVVA